MEANKGLKPSRVEFVIDELPTRGYCRLDLRQAQLAGWYDPGTALKVRMKGELQNCSNPVDLDKAGKGGFLCSISGLEPGTCYELRVSHYRNRAAAMAERKDKAPAKYARGGAVQKTLCFQTNALDPTVADPTEPIALGKPTWASCVCDQSDSACTPQAGSAQASGSAEFTRTWQGLENVTHSTSGSNGVSRAPDRKPRK